MQNFTAIGRLRRLKEAKMWQNQDLGLDPGLNSPEKLDTQVSHHWFNKRFIIPRGGICNTTAKAGDTNKSDDQTAYKGL